MRTTKIIAELRKENSKISKEAADRLYFIQQEIHQMHLWKNQIEKIIALKKWNIAFHVGMWWANKPF